MPAETPVQPPVRIADKPSAESFLAGLAGTMRALEAVMAQETAGVRAGRLREAMAGNGHKAELAAAYLQGLEAAKANAVALKRLAPAGFEALREAQRAFAATVETNQTVLATARTVSEGLMRSLAEELGRARTPSTYGMPSTSPSPYGRSGSLVLSRQL